jgi:very-short-patch-repair endonuclease
MLGAQGGAAPLPPRALAIGGEGEGVGGSMTERQEEEFDPRVPRARKLRRDMTDAERKLWWHLRRLPIDHSHFRRQATIGPYFADFACHERRLIIEADGAQHNQPENVARDAERSAYLRSQDYRILRFWNNDVLKNIDSVMEAILVAMHQYEASPPPLPPPHRAKLRGGRGTERPSRVAHDAAAPAPALRYIEKDQS